MTQDEADLESDRARFVRGHERIANQASAAQLAPTRRRRQWHRLLLALYRQPGARSARGSGRSGGSPSWLGDEKLRNGVRLAVNLIPFTGIAFLWFMGVLGDRYGLLEDRFFATVFMGSGLLFVAMLFVAAALSRGLLDTFLAGSSVPVHSEAYAVARSMAYALMNTFAVKMAAVFMIVSSTIAPRTAVLPRWVALVGFGFALVMLFVITDLLGSHCFSHCGFWWSALTSWLPTSVASSTGQRPTNRPSKHSGTNSADYTSFRIYEALRKTPSWQKTRNHPRD